ncbi:unnamed protein product [Taenia asiatica]|uniref:Fibronectin type-III domain-containing protein n=1 Tax=Taenia asiatica TaxID=60517 RepID=A0A0R3W4X3_TAEAS|nr:unnamed protein product [Taenia asiatica]
MLQSRTAVFSVLFALLISTRISTCAIIGHKGFQITTEVISPTRVRLSWESGSEVEGTKASRFRILCSSPDSAPVEAIATTTMVEMDTFTPGMEYTCEVHPVWDNLFEGIEVTSANPGISQPFVMNFKEQTDSGDRRVKNGKNYSYSVVNYNSHLFLSCLHVPSHFPKEVENEEENEAQTTDQEPSESKSRVEESGNFSTVKLDGHMPEVTAVPQVHAEATNGQIARVVWKPVEENGVNASRYRIICQTEDPLQQPVKIASTKQTEVEMGIFEPGLEYSCSVYAIWDNAVPGVEVMSASPGVSNAFRMPNGGE